MQAGIYISSVAVVARQETNCVARTGRDDSERRVEQRPCNPNNLYGACRQLFASFLLRLTRPVRAQASSIQPPRTTCGPGTAPRRFNPRRLRVSRLLWNTQAYGLMPLVARCSLRRRLVCGSSRVTPASPPHVPCIARSRRSLPTPVAPAPPRPRFLRSAMAAPEPARAPDYDAWPKPDLVARVRELEAQLSGNRCSSCPVSLISR